MADATEDAAPEAQQPLLLTYKRAKTRKWGFPEKLAPSEFQLLVYALPVHVRSVPVRVAYWVLLGTGALSALAVVIAANRVSAAAAFKCALTAAVNLVAAGHYHTIIKVREQQLPSALQEIAFKLGDTSDDARPKQRKADGEKWHMFSSAPVEDRYTIDDNNKLTRGRIFLQELMVDGLRHSDWLCTLPLMYLDLYDLAKERLQPGGEGIWLPRLWGAFIQACIVVLGAIHRFLLGEWRMQYKQLEKDACGLKKGKWIAMPDLQYFMSSTLWGGAAGLWAMTTAAVLGADFDTSTSEASDDVAALYALLLIQVGYPLTTLATGATMNALGWRDHEYGDGRLSFFKDASYALLDIVSKAGLALFAALRAQRQAGALVAAAAAAG
jgi:hypothetical protein